MIRSFITAAVIAGVVMATIPTAEARPRPRRGSTFEANKTFGLGVMFGAPTGLSGKYFVGSDTAIDFGIGAYYRYRGRDGLHIHADFLWHPVNLVKAEPFWLPLYFGIGGRFFDHDTHTHVGVRVPIGIAFDFTNVPLDVFFELAFVLDFLIDDNDNLDADLAPALGLRYYFE